MELLEACDDANEKGWKAYKDSLDVQMAQQALIKAQQDRMVQLENKPITSNPILWFISGMLVTGLTVRLVK
jgi:hypothetical protein